jgi:hypothetical protein
MPFAQQREQQLSRGGRCENIPRSSSGSAAKRQSGSAAKQRRQCNRSSTGSAAKKTERYSG